ncbi:sugar phosphate isomerase/epimerase family protein [Desulfocurvus sp. DL9XJH121]
MIRALYVNLPVSLAVREPGLVDLVAQQGLNAELGLDALALDEVPEAEHTRLAARLKDAGLRAGAHLPFMDLHPGGADALMLAAARERLARGMDRAMQYGADHMVGHAAYNEDQDGYRREAWLETSRATWAGLLAERAGHPPLHLENTYEIDPAPLALLLEGLAEESVTACLDVGHWFSFGGGSFSGARGGRGSLEDWMAVLGPHLGHLHLHDNHGRRDSHLGLGRGEVPFDALFAALGARGLAPTATLEPHTVEDFKASWAFVRAHGRWFGGDAP